MADLGTLLIATYVGLTRLATPAGWAIVGWRRLLDKEDPRRWRERLGDSALPRPTGRLAWVHAVSVGETVAALPLIARLTAAGVKVLVTSVTTTSATLAGAQGSEAFRHQFAPLDIAPAVERFLDHWRPDVAVFVESELWPVTIDGLHRRGIPLIVSNGRMSPRSARRWQMFPTVARAVFSRLPLVLAQSEGDADRFKALGAPSVRSVGNIKFDAEVPEAPAEVAAALGVAIGERPVFLAASTHPGEDEVVLEAFARLKVQHPETLLIILPRHPDRGGAIAAQAAGAGFEVVRRSLDAALPTPTTAVYVADTVGESGSFYRAATVALIGGSLVDGIGGHNPIEPARLGAAAVSGPYFANWLDVYAAFLDADGLVLARTAEELAEAAARLIADPARRACQSAAAATVVERLAGAVGRTARAVLDRLGPAERQP